MLARERCCSIAALCLSLAWATILLGRLSHGQASSRLGAGHGGNVSSTSNSTGRLPSLHVGQDIERYGRGSAASRRGRRLQQLVSPLDSLISGGETLPNPVHTRPRIGVCVLTARCVLQ
jgi:hypothetical protein